MSHLKRQKIPRSWPIERKGTKYIVRPRFDIQKGIPILIIIRDILKLAENRREVKKVVNAKKILLNNKAVKDEKNNVVLFDIITIIPLKKHYRLELSGKGKFQLKEIKEEETRKKIAKVIDKKILKGKRTQLNLSDGRNFISDIKCNINDSVLVNLKERKIEKCLPLKEKAKITIFDGRHIGKKGVINRIIQENKMAEINIDENKVNILIKQLMVIE